MNPFDLRGPEFLFFYIAFSVCTIVFTRQLREWIEYGPVPQVHLDDPYLFAYLNGGINEVFRAAIVVLLDRGWLIAEGDSIHRRPDIEASSTLPQVEQEVISFFSSRRPAYEALRSSGSGSAAEIYEKRTAELDLMPDARTKARRYMLCAVAICVLALLSLIKIGVALARGRTNILFLMILTILAPYLLARIVLPGPTAKGRALLRDVRTLFADLAGRRPLLRPGAGTKEIAWLVGVFGIRALPREGFPDVPTLFPLSSKQMSSGSCSSTACGTVHSCSTSGGGGCGGGCGGGGCGGGCGGCGS
jgi:uncharacterized protein (TIGR04222 family)